MSPCYAFALLSPCVSRLKLLLWWNAHDEFSLCSHEAGYRGGKINFMRLMPFPGPHLHLLRNVSSHDNLQRARESSEAAHMSCLICSMDFQPEDSGPSSEWATGENTNLSWSQSFLNMAALAQGLPWLLHTWLWPRFVLSISFCSSLGLPLPFHGSLNPH